MRSSAGQSLAESRWAQDGPSSSIVGGSVAQAELITLSSHLAILGRHVAIQPPELGIMSRFRFYLAFVGSDAEFFRLRLRCHVRHPNNGRASKSDSPCGINALDPATVSHIADRFCWTGAAR